ncbi:MAG: alpha-amylase family protein [Cyclobacteriaceae bacterium]|nr:alpha-amylase family protein [Cyclobacteriaceae bacterium]
MTSACSTGKEEQRDKRSEAVAPDHQKLVVYQIFTRLFGNKNNQNVKYGTSEQNGVGKFNDITDDAILSLKGLGITHIWYTGIIAHAVVADFNEYGIPLDDPDVVKGRAGSPYAIKDYYDVNPDLAVDIPNRMAEFEALIQRTHDQGLKVIIDFVPNHVARGYASTQTPEGQKALGEEDQTHLAFHPNNDFYYIPGISFEVPGGYEPIPGENHPLKDGKFKENPAKATGNDVFTHQPSVHDWFETIKINYGVDYQNNRKKNFEPIPSSWHKMKNILLFWAEKGVDGFRCDMAEMTPVEFWNWAVKEVKDQYPDVVFIAEIYNPAEYVNYIKTGGFDYLYDKVQLYDTLRNIISRRGSTDHIPGVMDFFHNQNDIDDQMLRFLENHDEQRIASPDFAGNAEKALPAMLISATIGRGPVMVYFGQEVGEPGAGDAGFNGEDGRTTIFDYWGVPEHQKWMNNGRFDGGQLSDEQKQLRKIYAAILNVSASHPVLVNGGFYDLHQYNLHSAKGYKNPAWHSYIRSYQGKNVLVFAAFEPLQSVPLTIVLPPEFLDGLSEPEMVNLLDNAAIGISVDRGQGVLHFIDGAPPLLVTELNP